MKIGLVIAESRPLLRSIWAEAFGGVSGVRVLSVEPEDLRALPDVDAELMLSMFAHDRYGGRPVPGQSQVIRVQGVPGMPPWVVTTPPIPARLESRTLPDGRTETVVIKELVLPPGEETYWIFTKVFEAIRSFRGKGLSPSITTVGFCPEILNLPQGDPRDEALGILRAYLDVLK